MPVTVERDIEAPPDQLWAMVSDVTRMGEWSPEATGAEWRGGATGAAVGAKFKGLNNNGKRSWSTACTVTECEPGTSFAFSVVAGPLSIAKWAYTFTPTATGCHVTETWTDTPRRTRTVPRQGRQWSCRPRDLQPRGHGEDARRAGIRRRGITPTESRATHPGARSPSGGERCDP